MSPRRSLKVRSPVFVVTFSCLFDKSFIVKVKVSSSVSKRISSLFASSRRRTPRSWVDVGRARGASAFRWCRVLGWGGSASEDASADGVAGEEDNETSTSEDEEE